MTTTRPKELIYFNFLPTQLEDDVHYMFYAVDDYSTFVFNLGLAQDFTFDSLLLHINKLMQDENFKSKENLPFTLMCSCGQEIEEDINKVIEPFNGEVVFDVDTVIAKTQHFVNSMNEFLSK